MAIVGLISILCDYLSEEEREKYIKQYTTPDGLDAKFSIDSAYRACVDAYIKRHVSENDEM